MRRILPLAALALSLAGCGTVENFRDGHRGQTKPYGGVKLAAGRFKPQTQNEAFGLGILWPFYLADVAGSAVGDTLTLPAAVAVRIVREINDHDVTKDRAPAPPAPPPAPGTEP